ncbi:hypothetical protein ACW9IO_12460, partial [Pseudomonas azotoformans]
AILGPARLTRRPAGLPTDSSLRSASVFDGAPQIKIKSDSLRIVGTRFRVASGLAPRWAAQQTQNQAARSDM